MSWSTPLTKYRDVLHMLSNPFKLGLNREEIDDGDLSGISAREQKIFSFQSLASATNNFHSTRKLGQGGFGPVFKGKLEDGREIAVKKLSQGSNQGKKEFINEAKLLISVQHRNIVTLLGYCVFGEEKLLVYEYLKNQSIDKFLFNRRRKGELNWNKRYTIITGMARGLLYLHEDSPNCIIHRDIKASNILLDDKWIPKIADFGLARLFGGDNTHVHTHVVGTNGYMAPEYVSHGKLSTKADVFSFGVVVLELISGQRNSTFDQDPNSTNLLDWSFKLYKKGRRMEIVDASLGRLEEAEEDQVSMCIQIALLCTQLDPHLRPGMSRVQVALFRKPGTLEDEPTWPGCCPGLKHVNHKKIAGVVSSASSSNLRRSSHEGLESINPTSLDSAMTTSLDSAITTSTSFGQIPHHFRMKNKIKKFESAE